MSFKQMRLKSILKYLTTLQGFYNISEGLVWWL